LLKEAKLLVEALELPQISLAVELQKMSQALELPEIL
jgi:hypothetical protein